MFQKGIKTGPFDCIQMPKTSEFPGAPVPGPHQVDPTPINAMFFCFDPGGGTQI